MPNRFHRVSSALLGLLACALAQAQTTVPSAQPLKGALLDGMGNHHHPVTTANPEAQKYFDQGMNLLYGFNHDEAMRSFLKASELDPKMAMAHWGIAMTLGPNYNVDVDPPREKAAYEAMQKAKQLADGVSPPERDYIAALAVRYSNDPGADLKKLAVDYSKAMESLSKKYPDDLDAATMYAESLMLLNPWHLWTKDGKPGPNTETIVATLESVLRRDPDHIGANHFYIHAIEGSTHAERALESAARLPGLAPAAGHLVHMPAHIYGRTGDQETAASSNVAAAAADQDYIKKRNDGGIYPMMYYSHNLHFLAYADMLQGNFAGAKKASDQLMQNVGPHIQMMPMLEGFATVPVIVLARFEKWDDVLKTPEPDQSMKLTRYARHFARSLAYAGLGKPDEAEKERMLAADLAKAAPPDAMYDLLNSFAAVAAVSDSLLAARISLAKNDVKGAIPILTKAVEQEDAMTYDEPPAWWFAVREDLADSLLRDGKAAEAEKVMRQQLEYSPRDGRALHILAKALKAEDKTYDAQWIEQQFKTAWKNADTQLK
jgi:tetratricopeptide (TPR) repeat protein